MWGRGGVDLVGVLYNSFSVSCRLVRVRSGGVVGVVFVFSVFASAVWVHGPCWEGVGVGEVCEEHGYSPVKFPREDIAEVYYG